MALLGSEAARRGLSLSQFAAELGCDLRRLERFFEAEESRSKTIQEMVRALGFPGVVASALCHRLSEAQIQDEIKKAHQNLLMSGRVVLRECELRNIERHFRYLSGDVEDATLRYPRLPETVLVALAEDHILARLRVEHIDDEILSPCLFVIDRVLSPYGFTLREYIDDLAKIAVRRSEGRLALLWAREALGLPEWEFKELQRIAGPYLTGTRDLEDFTGDDDSALDAAVKAYKAYIAANRGN